MYGGNSKVSLPSVSNMEYSTPSESAPMLDAMETGINSPVSAFRPIVNEMPNTSEERTLSPPQCRSEYLLANSIAWFLLWNDWHSIIFLICFIFCFHPFTKHDYGKGENYFGIKHIECYLPRHAG